MNKIFLATVFVIVMIISVQMAHAVAPPKILDFKMVAIDGFDADLTWTEPEGATSYQLQVDPFGDPIHYSPIGVLHTGSPAVFAGSSSIGILPGNYRLVAISSTNDATPSNLATGIRLGNLPSAPTLSVELVGTTAILTWTAPGSSDLTQQINGYTITHTAGGVEKAPIPIANTLGPLATSPDRMVYHHTLSHTIDDIDSSVTNVFTITAKNYVLGDGAAATQTVLGTLLPPTNLRAPSVTDTTITMAWDASAGADSYVLKYRTVGGEFTETTVTATTETIRGLTPDATYEIEIVAKKGQQVSEDSGMFEQRTLLPAPGSLRARSVTDTTITMEWVASTNASYVLKYRTGNDEFNEITVTAATTQTIRDLTLDTEYEIKIVAKNTDGDDGIESTVVTVRTLLPAPGNLRATSVTDTTIAMEWDASANASYVLKYRAGTSGGFDEITVTATTTQTIINLEDNTDYEITIAAKNTDGDDGVDSPAETVRTFLVTPTGLTVTSTTDTTITAEWNASAGADQYVLKYINPAVAGDFGNKTLSLTEATLTGLTPNQAYIIYVAARDTQRPIVPPATHADDSANSPIVSTRTLLPLGPPTNVAATSGDTQIILNWRPPSENGGDEITDYQVRYRTDPGEFTLFSDGVSTTTSSIVINLTNGQEYELQVGASNDNTDFVYSTAVLETPYGVPDAPASLDATIDSAQITLTWPEVLRGDSGAAVMGYHVECSDDSTTAFRDLGVNARETVFTGLRNYVEYACSVAATNAPPGPGLGDSADTAVTPAPIIVRYSSIYSNDGKIKINLSPYIDVSASSVDKADFVVSDDISITDVSLEESRVVLTLSSPITADNVGTTKVTYQPQSGRTITASYGSLTNNPLQGTIDPLEPFPATAIESYLPDDPDAVNIPSAVEAYVYSDDGTIKIRFSPRINVSASSVATVDFTVTNAGTAIPVTDVSLDQYKAVLTLQSPVTGDNIDAIRVSHNPLDDRKIALGTAQLNLSDDAVTNLLPGDDDSAASTTIRADYVYTDDGTIKIRFSPRINVDDLAVDKDDFVVSGTSVTDVSLEQSKAVLTLASPITSDNVGTTTVAYQPPSDSTPAQGALTLAGFDDKSITNLLPYSKHDDAPDILRVDYVYSDDGTIKIRFSPRIDVSASSVATGDFTVTNAGTPIPVTDVSLEQYKVVLTLASPITSDNVGTTTVLYDPGASSKIVQGSLTLAKFDDKPITNLLPDTVKSVRADLIYSDDGTIKIRFSPRIDTDISSITKADFVISGDNSVTSALLTKYKAILTLENPVTASTIDDITVSYTPKDGRIISVGEAVLPGFGSQSVTNWLP